MKHETQSVPEGGAPVVSDQPTFEWVTEYDGFVLRVRGWAKAVVYFIGGHVERPDSWYARLVTETEPRAFGDEEDAKQWAEETIRELLAAQNQKREG